MTNTKTNWVVLIGAAVIALSLLYVLRLYLPSGIAIAIAVTSGMAWGQFHNQRRIDLIAVPVAIALAFGTAQLFPKEWAALVALLFVAAGMFVGLWLKKLWPGAEENATAL